MNKTDRDRLRNKFGGKCAYCGCDLGKSFHADHVIAVRRRIERRFKYNGKWESIDHGMERPENDTFENLFPSCAQCNLAKMDMDIETFRSELQMQVERARKTSRNFRFAEKYGLIEVTGKQIVFWFEEYNPF